MDQRSEHTAKQRKIFMTLGLAVTFLDKTPKMQAM